MKKEILAVDNKKYMVDTLKIILERGGYLVTSAYSGEECLRKIGRYRKPEFIDISPGCGYSVVSGLLQQSHPQVLGIFSICHIFSSYHTSLQHLHY